jgi:hypothetical protein
MEAAIIHTPLPLILVSGLRELPKFIFPQLSLERNGVRLELDVDSTSCCQIVHRVVCAWLSRTRHVKRQTLVGPYRACHAAVTTYLSYSAGVRTPVPQPTSRLLCGLHDGSTSGKIIWADFVDPLTSPIVKRA